MSVQLEQQVKQVHEHAQLGWANDWLKTEKPGLYASGKWCSASGPKCQSTNPANGQIVGSFATASNADIDKAVNSAAQAFSNTVWRKMARRTRAKLLNDIAACIRRHHDELATLEALDNGKLFVEAFNDDLPETADVFDYYAGWTDKFYAENCPVDPGFINYTTREPVGVCALIVPWNFPLLLAAWKLAPALAMGNTVVLKPSPFTSLSTIRLIEILHEETELPPGVLNLVTGGAEAGAYLGEHSGVNKVSFTGSTATGKKVLRASADSNLKLVSLELGGKSPNIVFADVPDVEFAMQRSFDAIFSHKGEKCSEPTRLLVQRPLYQKFIEYLTKRAEQVVCGDPFDMRATQGAQCNQAQFDKIMHYIELGKADSRLVAGGQRDTLGTNASGLFVRPTIFADVDNNSAVAQDEIFGPVLAMMPFDTEEDAVRIANDTMYGLAAGLWTSDLSRAHRVAESLDSGMVFVNRFGCYDFASPFGGFKQSGWGKEMAIHSLESYTKLKSVWIKL